MTEIELQKHGIKRLLSHPKIWGWRNNTGAVKTGKRFIKYGYPGSADFIGLFNGRFLAIEFKSKNGKQSIYQKEFEKNVTEKGGIYKVISDYESFEEFFKSL